MFNIFIIKLKKYMYSKFADNTKLDGIADMLEGKIRVENDFDKLEKWSVISGMTFS